MGLKYEAKARLKSVYSIWRKMETKHVPFEEVYDLYAMRIIFDCDDPTQEKATCWQIYSAITDLYRLHPDRTRDWISAPKANGYQALHLTVMGPDGNWIEVQIRSRRMDEIAEKGFAAHWKYKIGGESDEESELNVWLRTIKDILDDPNPSAIDFLDTLKLNLFASEIVVFTPKGELITLPTGATVLDMAYTLHSQIGDKCIAGKVNHKLVPLSHRLSSGDQVEVLTSRSQTPKPEWLAFLATAKAKTRLKAALRRIQQPDIERGRSIIADYLSERQSEPTNEILTKMMAYYHVTTRDDLYLRLGRGDISLDGYILRPAKDSDKSLCKKILRFGRRKDDSEPGSDAPAPSPARINTKEIYHLHCGGADQNFIFPDCCRPIPGDDVMGFINDAGQVEVHSLTCPRAQVLKASFGNRILATAWDVVQQKFRAEILIGGIDRHGILSELTAMISKVDMPDEEMSPDVVGILFHPDLVYGTPLGEKISTYSFFDYSQVEALHLSDRERAIFLDCLHNIRQELEHPVDAHSASVLSANIQLLLEYMHRFYDRQFITRHKVNSEIVSRFERQLKEYYESGVRREGLPSVVEFADRANLSPGYFSDLVKRETGMTPKDLIMRHMVSVAKHRLNVSTEDVGIIAYDLGFQYPAHFSRMFKRATGMSPSDYRRSIEMN